MAPTLEQRVFDRPHRRLNPLTGEYVLVSPHRAQRPWQGQVEKPPPEKRPPYDPGCYLCPGNVRAGGRRNPVYSGTFAFDNDFAALLPRNPSDMVPEEHPLFVGQVEGGVCRVVCFSPRHDLTLPEMSVEEIEEVLRTWTEETRTLGAREDLSYVLVFENKGEIMGCSNPHPHSQIWATEHLPNEPAKEHRRQRAYFDERGRPLLSEYLEEEEKRGSRLVETNEGFVALVPYWALWPFETLILPRRPVGTLLELTGAERRHLALLLRRLTTRYDNLFEVSFPYCMGFHQAPFDGQEHPEWILHAHFYPPLLRSATVKKFMVGFEMLGTPGRDLSPEAAAERLRELSCVHYRHREDERPQGL
jgi:UDPglucose--hexose-1-phosphate uridylyltransferase